ncbi:MAG: carbohydrate kinase family protein [Deltaproteobacteria bacterium]|nr:carbohydrate kinase family protein [Candidatus Zymogenaceae bacterium]
MKKLDIVGFGLSTLDVVMVMKDMPNWEYGGWVSEFVFQNGGMAATAVAAAARLGADAGFIGTVGNDQIADLKLKFLADLGVDTSRMIVRPAPEGQVSFVYVHEGTGERVFAPNPRFIANPPVAAEIDKDYLTSADYLHMDALYLEPSIAAAEMMKKAGKQVAVDLGSSTGIEVVPEVRRLVELTDILITGEGFSQALTKQTDLKKAMREALKVGPRLVVETLGVKGCWTVTKDDEFHTPAFEVTPVNTTNAGDVFHGAYYLGLIKGWDLKKVAVFASAAAALLCTKLSGDRIPTYDQVAAFLKERNVQWNP